MTLILFHFIFICPLCSSISLIYTFKLYPSVHYSLPLSDPKTVLSWNSNVNSPRTLSILFYSISLIDSLFNSQLYSQLSFSILWLLTPLTQLFYIIKWFCAVQFILNKTIQNRDIANHMEPNLLTNQETLYLNTIVNDNIKDDHKLLFPVIIANPYDNDKPLLIL